VADDDGDSMVGVATFPLGAAIAYLSLIAATVLATGDAVVVAGTPVDPVPLFGVVDGGLELLCPLLLYVLGATVLVLGSAVVFNAGVAVLFDALRFDRSRPALRSRVARTEEPRAGFEPAVGGSAGRCVRPDSATLARYFLLDASN
jgi:hypothetical protein